MAALIQIYLNFEIHAMIRVLRVENYMSIHVQCELRAIYDENVMKI